MQSNTKSIISVGMLIGGATIGAGILGLPIQTGQAGIFPSIIGTLGIWILLTITAFIITDRFATESDITEDFPTVYRKEFGLLGKLLVILGYLINYYGIMVAYLCASVSILSFLLPVHLYDWCYLLIFFIPVAGITLFGLKYVLKANSFFMIVLIITFTIMFTLIISHLKPERITYTNWTFFPITLPIIVNAFLFHNIIPAVCRTMDNNSRKVKQSIIVGTVIACSINLVWIIAVLGVLPLGPESLSSSIKHAFSHSQPATVPLSKALKSNFLTFIGIIFAFCAIITSFVSVSIGLQGFLRDIFISNFKIESKILNNTAVFLPPLIISLAFPHFFLKAMGYAGGVGGLLIFGIFPTLLWLKSGSRGKMTAGLLMLLIFLYIMGVQIFTT
ncbi:MAG: hypothetical protein K9M56_05730 [Victivallales bacterium]|nr:hypothetical protein [Victivallales bacterium]